MQIEIVEGNIVAIIPFVEAEELGLTPDALLAEEIRAVHRVTEKILREVGEDFATDSLGMTCSIDTLDGVGVRVIMKKVQIGAVEMALDKMKETHEKLEPAIRKLVDDANNTKEREMLEMFGESFDDPFYKEDKDGNPIPFVEEPYLFEFKDIEDIIQFSSSLDEIDILLFDKAKLYFKNNKYILTIKNTPEKPFMSDDELAVIYEYGNRHTDETLEVIEEYGKLLIDKDAVTFIQKTFIGK